ncbi:hypothetical protein H9L21_01170 [Aeromicrobium senzhongii]|uniref:Uncharacterized protein n=1 Tax=Aeromicrobium senzhongii TaxID=2663859 RepID=A0ABX6SU12_9ACTN|nr:hypothetical protein [Aeromicrobium senzhongii]MTB88416.1 hypothetical protein [Aeromicrobium senzhongii]QNL94618.1 hypothetical protein H9L21_01170 [Aeromicrobium senzhongii]
MTESLATEQPSRQDSAELTRVLRVLERQRTRPEVMAEFFAGVGARGVVMALATTVSEPSREDVAGWDRLPDLLRDGLYAAVSWPGFDAEAFGADLAELLRDTDDSRRATISAITSFLLASGRYDSRLLAGWSRAFDELSLPQDVPLTWGSFLTGVDEPQPWSALAVIARQSAAADGQETDAAR